MTGDDPLCHSFPSLSSSASRRASSSPDRPPEVTAGGVSARMGRYSAHRASPFAGQWSGWWPMLLRHHSCRLQCGRHNQPCRRHDSYPASKKYSESGPQKRGYCQPAYHRRGPLRCPDCRGQKGGGLPHLLLLLLLPITLRRLCCQWQQQRQRRLCYAEMRCGGRRPSSPAPATASRAAFVAE